MVFSSAVFLLIFLPIVLLLYFCIQPKYRNVLLLIASLLFYAYGEPKFVLIMILSIVLNYVLALLVEPASGKKRKIFLFLTAFMNLGILFVFKYLAFSVRVINRLLGSDLLSAPVLALPIGISFFTFQALSYVIDVYRRKVPAQRNLLHVALYISFFPQLIAGPIVRYNTIAEQIEHRCITVSGFASGIHRFIIGLGKKVIIANNVAVVAQEAFSLNQEHSIALLWLGSICFTLQIFFDFSGYSDMAIGLGRMFGFSFEENFNYPYISGSITEFWRRWHMSLGQWFRDYVYIPLGGSRVGLLRNLLNLLVVWLLTGIWHGANYTFIFWGLMQLVMQLFEKFLIKPQRCPFPPIRWIWRIITLLMINFGWIVFNSLSLADAKNYILSMFGVGNSLLCDATTLLLCREYGIYILFGILFSLPIVPMLQKKLHSTSLATACTLLQPIIEFIIFLWGISFILLGSYNPFIYFNF